MTRVTIALLVSAGLASGCLDQLIPAFDGGVDFGLRTAGQTPVQDLGHVYAADPLTDGGVALKYAGMQAMFDAQGCTTTACHGGTQVPVLVANPTSAVALSNYYDLISGCANGTPDPSDCIDTRMASSSLLLAKTCATSGVSHMGGKPFADDTDPTYKLWEAWIAAGAPY